MDLGQERSRLLVAGASRGLGFSIMRQLLVEGPRAAAIGRERHSLDVAHEQWMTDAAKGTVSCLDFDLSDVGSVQPFAAHIADEDVLDEIVLVAGSERPTVESPIADCYTPRQATSRRRWWHLRRQFPFGVAQAVQSCPSLLSQGTNKSIVHLSTPRPSPRLTPTHPTGRANSNRCGSMWHCWATCLQSVPSGSAACARMMLRSIPTCHGRSPLVELPTPMRSPVSRFFPCRVHRVS